MKKVTKKELQQIISHYGSMIADLHACVTVAEIQAAVHSQECMEDRYVRRLECGLHHMVTLEVRENLVWIYRKLKKAQAEALATAQQREIDWVQRRINQRQLRVC